MARFYIIFYLLVYRNIISIATLHSDPSGDTLITSNISSNFQIVNNVYYKISPYAKLSILHQCNYTCEINRNYSLSSHHLSWLAQRQ